MIARQAGDLENGAIGDSEAEVQLQAIADLEAQMSEAFEVCDAPRREVVRDVYAQEFGAIAERDGDEAALWAAEFEERVRPYILEIDE